MIAAGRETLCVWLPLALADLVATVAGFGGQKLGRGELLESWMLPALAESVRDAERQEGFKALREWAALASGQEKEV